MKKIEEILIQGNRQSAALFLPILEKGAGINVVVGKTLRQLLVDRLGIEQAYIDDDIQTIFLNAKAIDNVDQTVICNGDVLALSGAMPGLAGATLRKGGKYAALRKEISGTKMDNIPSHTNGKIRLKLFNTVLKDLGPKILSKGVEVSGVNLLDRLKRCQKDKIKLYVPNKSISLPAAIKAISEQNQWLLKVASELSTD